METITVKELKQGKYPKVIASDKKQYGTSDLSAFEIGKSYAIEYSERDVEWEGKTFKARTITSAKLAPVASNGNGKYSAQDLVAFEKKDLWMARMAALKASVEMVKAEVQQSGATSDSSIVLSDLQREYYMQFLAEITK